MTRDADVGRVAPMSDTSPDAADLIAAGWSRAPGWRKLEQVRRLNALGCALALADIRARHPDADTRECLLRLASRCMNPAILRDLCGWDVAAEGY